MKLRSRFFVLFALLAAAIAYIQMHSDVAVPPARSFVEFPASHEGWRMTGQGTLSAGVLGVLKPTEYLSRRYVGEEGRPVDIFLGYFDGGRDSGGIHSPKHCLPGSGWTEFSSERTSINLDGKNIKLVKAVYGIGESRELLLYWFDMRGRSMSDEFSLKAMEIVNSALYRRRDESFIRISVPMEKDMDKALARGEDFLRDFYPVIRDFLPS